ncbi:hypothetical protein KM043_001087 [Ampulex compressa]|nr:hypothetical protein KM043_001087 [Ampulex compressa]
MLLEGYIWKSPGEAFVAPRFSPSNTKSETCRQFRDLAMQPIPGLPREPYPPLNPLWHAILGFVIGLLGVISISGNGMVVYIFSTTKSLRTPSNLLVINLAVTDFLMMFCMSPPMVINCYYETYNVIVKGLSAKPLTINGALLRILGIWLFSVLWTVAPVLGWNRYVPEGNMTACGTDYFSRDIVSVSYIVLYSIWCYFMPLFLIIWSYWYIIKAVAAHEKNMREQAKKMNVASLRSAENQNTSAECKLAKVALMTISLWFMAWTPYLIINWSGIFNTMKISPLTTIWGSLFAKANAVYNPIVYGISHPKYRAALFQRFPSLACAPEPAPPGADATSTVSGVTTVAEGEKASA